MSKKNNTAQKSALEIEQLSKALREGTEKTLRNLVKEAIEDIVKDDDEKSHEPESIEDDVIVALRSAFMKPAETCKSILRSRFFAEKSYKEISAELGVDVNQVGVRISRCLVRLRVLLSAEGIQAEDVL